MTESTKKPVFRAPKAPYKQKDEWTGVLEGEYPEQCSNETFEFCKTLTNAVDNNIDTPRAKGLHFIVISDREADSTQCIGVAYKKTAGDIGCMLNHCPFCGENILWHKTAPWVKYKEPVDLDASADPESDCPVDPSFGSFDD